MPCTTGVSTTSNISWRHSLCTESAMQCHQSLMCSEIVLISGHLVLYIAYFVNHPLYTPANEDWFWVWLGLSGIYQWLGFNIATQTVPPGYVFLVVATGIMTNWEFAKYRGLRKLFDGKEGRPKYPRRWVILPPFL